MKSIYREGEFENLFKVTSLQVILTDISDLQVILCVYKW